MSNDLDEPILFKGRVWRLGDQYLAAGGIALVTARRLVFHSSRDKQLIHLEASQITAAHPYWLFYFPKLVLRLYDGSDLTLSALHPVRFHDAVLQLLAPARPSMPAALPAWASWPPKPSTAPPETTPAAAA